MLKNILVPLDGSELAERALPYATALGRRAAGAVLLVRAVRAQAVPAVDPGPAQVTVADRATVELNEVVERLRGEGLRAEAHVYDEAAAAAILDASRRLQAGLVVMSTHGRAGLGRWIYGSVADDVLRHSEVPVLLVPPHCEHAWPANRPLRVLVPLDGSELAEAALRTAELLAETSAAELVLLRVVEPPIYPLYGDGYAYIPIDEEAELALAEQVERLRAGGTGATARTVVGQPAMAVATVAREVEADVIAMATHGRGGLARLVMGSVATGALQRATVPLLLTRPAALERPIPPPRSTASPVTGPPVVMTLSAEEAGVVRQALESFLADARREEHVTRSVRDVLTALETAEATAATSAG